MEIENSSPTCYYLVTIPQAGKVEIQKFNKIEDLVEFCRQLKGSKCQVLVFKGVRLYTTRPPNIELIDEKGDHHPIEDIARSEIDEEGFMYVEEESLSKRMDRFPDLPNRRADLH